MKGYELSDTICAIATAEGAGAIGVLRLSGNRAIEIAASVFRGKNLLKQDANRVVFGKITDGETEVDEVLATVFRSPSSYTGEDVVEFSCHGSVDIQGKILELLIGKGARMASPGEFTFRAFVNGKMDLSQAEAVADLIASDSEAARKLALSQLRGGYSEKLKELRSRLVDFASLLELELDFSEEDVEFADRAKFLELIREIKVHLTSLIESFKYGNAVKEGIPVAILGAPNVGKSTLLNKILQEEKAIVSEIPGTTRDLIEDVVNVKGIRFRFIDTAGLRETSDQIERLGIDRALARAAQSSIVLYVLDGTMKRVPEQLYKEVNPDKTFVVVNKKDKLSEVEIKNWNAELKGTAHFFISAGTGEGVPEMMEEIHKSVTAGISDSEGAIVTSKRHVDALQKCLEVLIRAEDGLNNNISGELVAMEIRSALRYLGEITGEVTTDDLLGNIFSRFCIGK